MGSFMAPMEAAGEAMAELGDVAATIAVKEQQLRDNMLADDLQSEMSTAIQTMRVEMSEAKTLEDMDRIRNAFDEDFRSMAERAGDIKGDALSARVANQLTVQGGGAALQAQSQYNAVSNQMARNQKDNLARQLLLEGVRRGDLEGAIGQIRGIFEDGVGSVYGVDENIDAMVREIVSPVEEARIQHGIDEGTISESDILSSQHLKPERVFDLLSDLADGIDLRASKDERLKAQKDREFIASLGDQAVIAVTERGIGSEGAVRDAIFKQYGNSDKAKAVWFGYYSKVMASHLDEVSESLHSDSGEVLLSDAFSRIEEAFEASGDDPQAKDVLEAARKGVLQMEEQRLKHDKVEEAKTLGLHNDLIDAEINATAISLYEGKPFVGENEYRKQLEVAAGIYGKSPEQAYEENGITRQNYILLKRKVLEATADGVQRSLTPVDRLAQEAVKYGDPKAVNEYADHVFLNEKSFDSFFQWMSGGEVPEGQAKQFENLIEASSKGKLPIKLQKAILAQEDLKAVADMWVEGRGKGIPFFSVSDMSSRQARGSGKLNKYESAKAEKITLYVSKLQEGPVSKEESDRIFRAISLSPDDEVRIANSNLSSKRRDAFATAFTDYVMDDISGEDIDKDPGDQYRSVIRRDLEELIAGEGGKVTEDIRVRAEKLMRNGIIETIEERALYIARGEEGFDRFLSGESDQVHYGQIDDVYDRAITSIAMSEGKTLFSPRWPGQSRAASFSAEKMMDFNASNHLPTSKFNLGSAVRSGGTGYNPLLVATRDALIQSFGTTLAFKGDVWAKNVVSHISNSADLLEVMRYADGVRVGMQQESNDSETSGSYVSANWTTITEGRSEELMKEHWKIPVSKESLIRSKYHRDKIALPTRAFQNLVKSGQMTYSQGSLMTREELAAENAKRSMARKHGVDAPHLDFGYKIQVSLVGDDGRPFVSSEFIPSVDYAINDVYIANDVARSLKQEGEIKYKRPGKGFEPEEGKPVEDQGLLDLTLPGPVQQQPFGPIG